MAGSEENHLQGDTRVPSGSHRRVRYSGEFLKRCRQQLDAGGSLAPRPLSKPVVAPVDALMHIDPKRNLGRLAQSTNPTSSEPQVKFSATSSTKPPPHTHNAMVKSKEHHTKPTASSGSAAAPSTPSYASVARHRHLQVKSTTTQAPSNVSHAAAHSPVTPGQGRDVSNQNGHPAPSPNEHHFFSWRRGVPRDNAAAYKPLGRSLGRFFQQALVLVRSDPNLMQQVITLLAQEGGLRRVNEVLASLDTAPAAFQKKTFEDQVLPFLRTISHERVLASAVLEAPLIKIYQFIYGPNGSRAVGFFTSIFTLFKPSELDPLNIGVGDSIVAASYEPSVLVLSKMVDLNGDALVNENFRQLVESVSETIGENDDDAMLATIRKHLHQLRRRLRRAVLNISDKDYQSKPEQAFPKFEITQDLPGRLSAEGPRHDNDSDNICDIKIMPSSQEIQSEREEYLPSLDPSTWHLPGLPGLLDRHFRLLREDTVGQLRDAVAVEYKRMRNPDALQSRVAQQKLRTFTYHDVQFVRLLCDSRGGLRFVVQFEQPPYARSLFSISKRREWWQTNKRLQLDALVCLIDSTGSAVFCYVSGFFRGQPPKGALITGKAMDENLGELARDQNYSSVVLSLVQQDAASLKEILGRFRGSQIFKKECLVEFPGVLLPSFQPTLLALQDMAKSLNLPFSEILAPESTDAVGKQEIAPPSYALQNKFAFNLRSIMDGEDLMLSANDSSFDFQRLQDGSSLDDTQATALVDSLTRSLALIQGPPGTGKSYTGVAIIKVLLDNRKRAKLGPVICVCYTNHALDQLLEQLVHSEVKNVIRIGSRSKSNLLDRLNLRVVAESVSQTKTEGKRRFEARNTLMANIYELNQCLDALSKTDHWTTIKEFLDLRYPEHHDELFGRNEEGWHAIHHHPEQIIPDWVNGEARGDPNVVLSVQSRPIEDLHAVRLHRMSRPERYMLAESWMSEIREDVEARIQDAYTTYLEDKGEFERLRTDLNLRCLQSAQIIGVTTTGLAKNLDLLRRLPSKVVICEEAGEVLEAHSLTTLLPSVEHAIFIGDHQQLRPKIQNWELHSENPRGQQYSLDVSMFERLVNPLIESNQLPYSTLETQRRMDPSISRLIRRTLYPNLKDSNAVRHYPVVRGMKRRLFWFHHEQPEATPDPTRLAVPSHHNEFEIEFTAALVSHLVKQGVYGEGEIAVLTPYLGQLMRLRKRLSETYEVVLGERDVEELEQAGFGEPDISDASDESLPPVDTIEKTTLLKALRVSTVDNFQGEEAKVVVISLVRSNKEQQCGFLRTSNRINVLLSRAKHGMYIIGNADTSYKVDMWAQVIRMLDHGENFGESLELECPRHPDSTIYVSAPEDFHAKAPEGGCDQPCNKRLQCGHFCQQSCHSDLLHRAVYCTKPCTRPRHRCDHPCPKLCGDPCPDDCQVIVRDVELECGHIQNVPCWQAQNRRNIKCLKVVEKVAPFCGHTIKVQCSLNVAGGSFKCPAFCGAKRDCGHICKKWCHQCRKRSEDKILDENHGACQEMCGRQYSTCNHSCMMICHKGQPCQPCIAVCETACVHSKCEKLCREPCSPCTELRCSSACPHGNRCTMPCAAPCNWMPCEKRCEKKLSCGHRCPTVCGEMCPTNHYCQVCAPGEVKEQVVDFIELCKYKDADLDRNPAVVLRCGHLQTIESMDGLMQMTSFYNFQENGKITGLKTASQPFSAGESRVCPACRGSLRDVARYGRIVRRAILDSSTKKFLIWSTKNYCPLGQQVDLEENQLLSSRDSFVPEPTPPHLRHQEIRIEGPRTKYLDSIRSFPSYQNRYAAILGLRNGINLFVHQVRNEEEPFTRIFDLISAKNGKGGSADSGVLHTSVMQTRGHLLASALLIRCDLAILTDYLALRRHEIPQVRMHVDLSFDRKECEELIAWAGAREQPRQFVEGHIFLARFAALEAACATNPEIVENLREKANYHLDYAHTTAEFYPNQIKDMQKEVEQAKRLLSEEKKLEYEVCIEDRQAMLARMATEFSAKGRWYTCVKGHPFTVEGDISKLFESGCPHCDGEVIIPDSVRYESVDEGAGTDAGDVSQATTKVEDWLWDKDTEEDPWKT